MEEIVSGRELRIRSVDYVLNDSAQPTFATATAV
jgi:hypothetical protein